MRRRSFLSGVVCQAAPVPLSRQQPIRKPKPTRCVLWGVQDIDAIKVGLTYDDRTSSVTTIPSQWLYQHPIEYKLLRDGAPHSSFKLDWVDLCAEVVQEFIAGK